MYLGTFFEIVKVSDNRTVVFVFGQVKNNMFS